METARAAGKDAATAQGGELVKRRTNVENGGKGELDEGNRVGVMKFEKDLTVVLEIDGDDITAMNLIKATKEVCGRITACRVITKNKYEVTVASVQAKDRLLDGFRVGETRIHGREVTSDELVVSFMGLPAYIEDEEITAKLQFWGVSAVSAVRRKMWPGTDIADGTRYVKVRFTDTVQSLPYSARFITAAGPEFFRVIHDRQVRVCRGCLQPDHVYRDCPEFLCRRCGGQGHYARECAEPRVKKCSVCRNRVSACVCGDSDPGEGRAEAEEGEVTLSPADSLFLDLFETDKGERGGERPRAEAPGQEEARGVESRLAPSRGGRAPRGPTPNATVAGAEPGKEGSSGPVPLSTPGREGAAPKLGRTPRPEEGNGSEQRTAGEQKDGEKGKVLGLELTQLTPVMGKPRTRIAHTPRSGLPMPLHPAPVSTSRPAAGATWGGRSEEDLMDFNTEEIKKRQNENEGGKKTTKKHK